MITWFSPSRDRATATKKNKTQARIRDSHAEFQEAVLAATGAKSHFSETFVEDVSHRFEALKRRVDEAASGKELETLEDQAEALALLQAYVCPRGEIKARAEAALQTMLEWSVPATALDSLRKEATPQLANADDLEAARGALHTVLEEQSSWSRYIDEYNDEMRLIAYWLSGAIGVTLVVSLLFVTWWRLVIWGAIFAGACGALVSVISKLPGLQISGDSAPYKRGIFRRLCMGLAASVIGVGLLATGFVTITLPGGATIGDIFDACGRHTMAGTPPPPRVEAPGAASSAAARPVRTCHDLDVFILIGIVMVFGFSERALTAFEDKILPQKS